MPWQCRNTQAQVPGGFTPEAEDKAREALGCRSCELNCGGALCMGEDPFPMGTHIRI